MIPDRKAVCLRFVIRGVVMEEIVKCLPSILSNTIRKHNPILASITVKLVNLKPIAFLVAQLLNPKGVVITTVFFEEFVCE